jgi:hypothetical protein
MALPEEDLDARDLAASILILSALVAIREANSSVLLQKVRGGIDPKKPKLPQVS